MIDFKPSEAIKQKYGDPALGEAMQKAIDEMVRQENLHIENLTREQVAEVLRQIFACGDITRLVYVTGTRKQEVVYEPFKREQELMNRIVELEDELRYCKLFLPKYL